MAAPCALRFLRESRGGETVLAACAGQVAGVGAETGEAPGYRAKAATA